MPTYWGKGKMLVQITKTRIESNPKKKDGKLIPTTLKTVAK